MQIINEMSEGPIGLKKQSSNNNLNIVIENQMSCAIFSKQIKCIVICKIFKLQKYLNIQIKMITYKQKYNS